MSSGKLPEQVDRQLRRALILYQRDEIIKRYDFDALSVDPVMNSKGLLKGLAPVDIERLKNLFLAHFYPPLESRTDRDESFAVLVKMLWNPKKIMRFVPSISGILLKYNVKFYPAMKAGLNAMRAYHLSMVIENNLVRLLYGLFIERGLPFPKKGTDLPTDVYLKAYTSAHYHDFAKLIEMASHILGVAREREVIDISLEILRDVKHSLTNLNTGGIYNQDIKAIDYGIDMLSTIHDVFGLYSEEKAAQLVQALVLVEMRYLDTHHGKTV